MTEYAEHLSRLSSTHPELAAELAPYRTLEGLLNWLRARGGLSAALDLVTQDEFSHDLLVPVRPSAEWLSFGMT